MTVNLKAISNRPSTLSFSLHSAIVMAEFARECMQKVTEVIRELELTLGPDTAELAMRFGVHSGPITAGVLRGDRARFQLFGDTVRHDIA